MSAADGRKHDDALGERRQGGCGACGGNGCAGGKQSGVQAEEEARALPRELDLRPVVGMGALVEGEGVGGHWAMVPLADET